ncbi:hypothetical protein E3Q16_04198 [Wallemia mellicola]|nr:hypothetical protein E3Q21_04193 [Wallemia mellicola]TIB83391.1 hypothetical protein E3Q20_04164 [Wallemia mellicola]TIB99328.1 hypothetical protein E3Q16_04198 [Wallemia mellicola]TIC30769.1 hypothetical protein E3Q09_04212 [Wallemia mellicola]TIC37699.1 hypothetical protein E3Q07_04203 [Wallemia mellicola]
MASTSSHTSKEVDITRENSASNLLEESKDFFEISRTWEVLHRELFNSTLKYGEDAKVFYRRLEVLYNELQKVDTIIGEEAKKDKAIRALPDEMKETKVSLYLNYSQTFGYDDLIKKIINYYNASLIFEPTIEETPVNQTTSLKPVNKQDEENNNTSEVDYTQANDLLRRISLKFCFYCSRNNYRRPHTHTDNECGHLYPELKERHKGNRKLNRIGGRSAIKDQEQHYDNHTSTVSIQHAGNQFTPDLAVVSQLSKYTCTNRRDLLTNVRELVRPYPFLTTTGPVELTTMGTMELNLEYQGGIIKWVDTEVLYCSVIPSTLLGPNILQKYNLGLLFKPQHSGTFFDMDSGVALHKVPLTHGKVIFKLNLSNYFPTYEKNQISRKIQAAWLAK